MQGSRDNDVKLKYIPNDNEQNTLICQKLLVEKLDTFSLVYTNQKYQIFK